MKSWRWIVAFEDIKRIFYLGLHGERVRALLIEFVTGNKQCEEKNSIALGSYVQQPE